MSSKAMKAYHVGEDCDGRHVIWFAAGAVQARREGGGELGLAFDEVSFCRRAPWADQYAGEAFIPAKVYHEQGWWLSCPNCAKELMQDSEDDNGQELRMVYDGASVFCDDACKTSFEKGVAELNENGEAFKSLLLEKNPDLTFTEFNVGWPRISISAKFTFPGCQFGGSVYDSNGDGKLEWFVSPSDRAAWDAYQASRSASI